MFRFEFLTFVIFGGERLTSQQEVVQLADLPKVPSVSTNIPCYTVEIH
jgi:hypothetical protein